MHVRGFALSSLVIAFVGLLTACSDDGTAPAAPPPGAGGNAGNAGSGGVVGATPQAGANNAGDAGNAGSATTGGAPSNLGGATSSGGAATAGSAGVAGQGGNEQGTPVNGRIKLGNAELATAYTVHVDGRLVPVGSDGSFNVASAPAEYDLVVEKNGQVNAWRRVTHRSPAFAPGIKQYSAEVQGDLIASSSTLGQRTFVAYDCDSGDSGAEELYFTNRYGIVLRWNGATKATCTLHVLSFDHGGGDVGFPTAYKGYTQQVHKLENDQHIEQPATLASVATETVTLNLTLPAGADPSSATLELGPIPSFYQTTLTTTSKHLLPKVGLRKILTPQTQGLGHESWGVQLMNPEGTLSPELQQAPRLKTPGDWAKVAPTDEFTWSGPEGWIWRVTIQDAKSNQRLEVRTAERRFNISELTRMGIRFPSDGEYTWEVRGEGAPNKLDDELLVSPPARAPVHHFAYSDEFEFTLK